MIMQKGAFSVAAKTGVPVVPITLLGTGKLMPAGMEGMLNPGSVKVIVHRPIEGNDANTLCCESRNAIANALLVHGYGVHGNAQLAFVQFKTPALWSSFFGERLMRYFCSLLISFY